MEEEKVVVLSNLTIQEKTVTFDRTTAADGDASAEFSASDETRKVSGQSDAAEPEAPEGEASEEGEAEDGTSPEDLEALQDLEEKESQPEESLDGDFEEEESDKESSGEDEKAGATVHVVGVRFRTAGKIYYFTPGNFEIHKGQYVIVETARGQECGITVCDPMDVPRKKIRSQIRPIRRTAGKDDLKRLAANRAREKDAYRICARKIREHGLDMKLIDAEYTFDGSKLMFYFTADGRVDFRDLVKDLAGIFRMRVELRQIGVRDETRILGGYGICGRPLCCHAYLSDFIPVSIKMAKEQNLSLNPAKISGVCGRLMCCLKNEEETYEELNKNLPRIGDEVQAADGLTGEVESVNVLRQRVRIIVEVNDEKELHEYEAKDLTILRRRKRGQAKPKFHRGDGAEVHLDGTRTGGSRETARSARSTVREAIDRNLRENAEEKEKAQAAQQDRPRDKEKDSREGGGRNRNRRRRGGGGKPDAQNPNQSQNQTGSQNSGQGQSRGQGKQQGRRPSKNRDGKPQDGKNQDRKQQDPGSRPRSSHDKRRRRPGGNGGAKGAEGSALQSGTPAPQDKT